MQKIGFAEALDAIVASDRRYQREAYVFLRDALDFTTKQQKKAKGATVRHVLTHTSQGTPGAAYRYDGGRFSALTAVVEACQGRPFRQALALAILDRTAMTMTVPGHDLDQPAFRLQTALDRAQARPRAHRLAARCTRARQHARCVCRAPAEETR